MTPEQIARELEDIGTELPISLAAAIQTAANAAIEEMKARLVTSEDASGELRRSIAAVVDQSNLTLGITMNEYGYFQNYGVLGVKDRGTVQLGLEEPVANAFGAEEEDTMRFGTGNYSNGGRPWGAYYSGLDAKDFIKLELFIDRVKELVNQNLEL